MTGAKKKAAIERAIELCFLQHVVHQTIDTLSKGYKHRTCLAQSLIHDPQVLIMDEPTDGLDPNQKHEVRSLTNPLYARPLVNRNPDQSNNAYVRGHDGFRGTC